MKKLCSFIPAILIMIMIFMFSSQTADDSTITSTTLGRGIILVKSSLMNEKLSRAEIEEQALSIEHVLRKCAHATEYMLLALSLAIPLVFAGVLPKVKKLNRILIGLAITVLYACSDELHQYFVPGRSAQVIDVLIDSIGAIVGLLILGFVIHLRKGNCLNGSL